jgi:[ribosomal protein S5]-alanine N-acetyltransferase
VNPFLLRSPRLGFRQWHADDLPLARALWTDPAVTRLISREPFSEEQVAARLEKEISTASTQGIQYWPIFTLEGGEHVGCCGLKAHPTDPAAREMGFHLRPGFWGRGYASEAAAAVVEHAFTSLDLPGLFAGHHPENAASARILRKLSFERIGEFLFPPTGLIHPWYYRKR